MLALLAGVELDGLVGALIGVPVAGILYVLVVAIYWEWSGSSAPVFQRRTALAQARALVRRRVAAQPTVEGPLAVAGVLANPVGDAAPPPTSLAGLEEHAAALRETFEQTEEE